MMGRARPRGPPPSPQTTRRPAPIRAGAPARTVTFRRRPAAVWPGRTAGRRSTPAPSVLTTARRQRARQTLSLEFRWPRNLFVRGEKRDEGRGQPWAVTSPESPVAIGSRGVVKARRREEDLRSADLQTCPLFNFLACGPAVQSRRCRSVLGVGPDDNYKSRTDASLLVVSRRRHKRANTITSW